MRKETNEPLRQDDELDLGILLNFIVRVIRRILQFIIDIVRVLAFGLINFLLFIRKSLVLIIIILVLSLAAAWFVRSQFGIRYQASMAVKIQPDISPALYEKASYLSELMKHGQYSSVSSVLGIPVQEAQKLSMVSVEPVMDELTEIGLYKEHVRVQSAESRDTLLTSQIRFSDFTNNLKDRDYPLQQITIYSNTPDLPAGLEDKFVASLFSETLKLQEQASLLARQQQIAGVTRTREGIDSMALALQANLRKSNAGSGNTDVLMKGAEKTPETEIYEKMVSLDAELYRMKTEASHSGNYINVVSSLPTVAVKTGIANQYFFHYFWIVFAIGFGFLLLLNFLKMVPAWERSLRREKSA